MFAVLLLKFYFNSPSLSVWVIKLGLRSAGKIYTTMQNSVKIGHMRYHIFSTFNMQQSVILDFQIFKFSNFWSPIGSDV